MSRIEEIIKYHTSTMGFVAVKPAMEQYGKELLEKAAENAKTKTEVEYNEVEYNEAESWACQIVDKKSILETIL